MANLPRTIKKAVSYRIVATLTTAVFVIALSGNFALGLSVGIADLTLKTLLFIAHDYLFDHLHPADQADQTIDTNQSEGFTFFSNSVQPNEGSDTIESLEKRVRERDESVDS